MSGAISSLRRLPDAVAGLGYRKARLLALAAGAVYTLSFAPVSLFPSAFVAFPILILLIDNSRNPVEAMRYGWWFGFGHFLTGLFWVGNSFAAQDNLPAWAGIFAATALAIALSYFVAIPAALARRFWASGWRRIFLFAGIFCLFEWLRGHLFTGFPWNLAANIWGGVDAMIQPVSLIGSYGLGVITVLAASTPVLLVTGKMTGRERWAGPLIAILVLGGLGAWGEMRLFGSGPGVHDLRMRVVQAGIPQREKWAPEKLGDNFVRHLEMSIQATEAGAGADITHVIWPETAVPYFIDEEPSRRHLIARALGNRRTLITGARRLDRAGENIRLFNSLHVVDPAGSIAASYDKAHLVPFGEYLPLRYLLAAIGFGTLVNESIDFSAGEGPKTVAIPGLPAFSPLICYEIIFPGAVTDPENRPAWLLNLTNDAWYGRSPGPHQHLMMTQYRAVEEGLPVVRAASTGISAIIDPYGRIIDSLPLGVSDVLDFDLPKPLPAATLFVRFGDMPFFVMLALMLALGLTNRLNAAPATSVPDGTN